MAVNPILRPHVDRVIALSNHIPTGSYGVQIPQIVIRLPARRSSDVLDYWVDASAILGPDTNDHVTNVRTIVAPAADPADMTVSAVDESRSGLIAFLFSGGRSGIEYRVTATFVTTSGRTVSCEFAAPISGAGILAGNLSAATWEQISPAQLRFPRGAVIVMTLRFTDDQGADVDVSGTEITGTVRTADGLDVATGLGIAMTNIPSVAVATAPSTADWPIGRYIADLRIAFDGHVVLSETFPIWIDAPRAPG